MKNETAHVHAAEAQWFGQFSQFAREGGSRMTADKVRTLPTKAALDSERLALLGIPSAQMTEQVSLAVSALLEKLDDVTRELTQTKENLAEIERLVDVDVVAPIPNRRAFLRRLSWAINMHERYGHPSTILYFDLNDFKQINDTYGHTAGDYAIRHVSELLSTTMRESDFLARIGGDEFAVIMYYASEEAAKKRGIKIVEKLQATPFIFNETELTLSASLGYYSLRNGDAPEGAMSAADLSMYEDKKRRKSSKIEPAA
jgi:diguanylate cyclase (GGDEF)-like protein